MESDGKERLPEWVVFAIANFDASLCRWVLMVAVFELHSVEVS